jgi:outer membrane protein OmpA-like peptidoglycan-associated protein
MKKMFSSSRILAATISLIFFQLSFPAWGNVLGNVETFSVDSDLLGFESVHSSSTLKQGWVNLGVFGYYSANDFLTYQNLNQPLLPSYQQEYDFRDKMVTTEVLGAVGLLENLEFTFNMPIVLYQSYDHTQTSTVNITRGAQSFRPGLKYNFWKTNTQGLALLFSTDIPTEGSNIYLGNTQNPIFNFEAAWDTHLTPTSLFGINIGYRKRTPGLPITNSFGLLVAAPLQDQFTASAGFTHSMNDQWSWTAELFGSTPESRGLYPSTKALTTLEVLGALRYKAIDNLFLHAGATGNVIGGGLSPDYRLYAGLNYMFDLFGSTPAQAGGSLDLDRNDKGSAAAALTITPKRSSMSSGEQRILSARGGNGPYHYEVISGDGVVDSDSGKFTAGNPGTNRIRVTDANSNTSEAIIMVKAEAAPLEPKNSMLLNPASASLYEGARENFAASGGVAPYHYSISKGLGQIDEQTGEYIAPSRPGEEDIIVADSNGMKATAHVSVKAIPKATKEFVLNNLHFKFNSDQLVPSALPLLKKAVVKMKALKIKSMIIAGHTDLIGTVPYNKLLSVRRADAIRLILIKDLKLDPSAVTAVGFGKDRPLISPERSAKDRLKNRRVEIKLYAD